MVDANNHKRSLFNALFCNHFFKGALSGFLAGTGLQPFDVIKTNSQINPFNDKRMLKMREVARNVYIREGLTGFYRGFVAACVKTSCSSGVYFGSLKLLTKLLKSTPFSEPIINTLASGVARTLQAVTTNPIVLIKGRLEVIGFNHYKGLADAFKTIYRLEGWKGYFTGTGVTIIRDVPFSSLYYPIYEGIKKIAYRYTKTLHIKNEAARTSICSSSSALGATVISLACTQPLDTLLTRKRYEYYNTKMDQHFENIISGVKKIIKRDGIRGLYLGTLPRFLKKGLGTIFAWSIFEQLNMYSEKLK